MNQKEIFNLLGNGIIDAIPNGMNFQEAILNILRLEGVVEFNCFILNNNQQKVNLEINMGYKYAKAIIELYHITQNDPIVHKNWNRAKYILYPEGRFEIEYIWDQELQDQVDKYNNEV